MNKKFSAQTVQGILQNGRLIGRNPCKKQADYKK